LGVPFPQLWYIAKSVAVILRQSPKILIFVCPQKIVFMVLRFSYGLLLLAAWWLFAGLQPKAQPAAADTALGLFQYWPAFAFAEAEEPANMKGITARHNYWRARYGVSPLTWSPELAKVAQAWAEELKKKGCQMEHSTNRYGENIYWSQGIANQPEACVDAWASELKDYDFEKMKCIKEWYYCGHFTQLVWENTKSVGCAMVKCEGGQELWLCNYDPPGNVRGELPFPKENIKQQKNQNKSKR
jgi:hypothetical protein